MEGCSSYNVSNDLVLPLGREPNESLVVCFGPMLDKGLKDVKVSLACGLDDEGRLAVLTLASMVDVELRDGVRHIINRASLLDIVLEHVVLLKLDGGLYFH